MSKENEKTVEVYENNASIYLATTIAHDNLNPDKAKRKRENLENFIKTNIKNEMKLLLKSDLKFIVSIKKVAKIITSG